MKLFVLHLSDIHFETEDDYNEDNVNGIVNALKLDQGIEAVLVIVSGDITYSGYRRQYSAG
jgi:3',5'-cyclic AMP phosphodiesterase CpdA